MRGLGRVYAGMMEGCGLVAAALFAATAVLIVTDVTLRNVNAGGIAWALEAAEYALPAATFLAAPWVLFHNTHVRVEIVTSALPPSAARLLGIFGDLAGFGICAVLVIYGLVGIADSRALGSLVIKTLVFPEWWALAPVPVAGMLLAIEFLRRIAMAISNAGPANPQ